ncbi:Uncharacterised protein [Shigella flexneri]|nr:Uncharacterised protein [Shigella flexneri]
MKGLAVYQDLAAGGGIRPRQHLHQRAFSRAVFPHQGMDLARVDRQIHPFERIKFAEGFGNIAHLKNRRAVHGGLLRGCRYQHSITGK